MDKETAKEILQKYLACQAELCDIRCADGDECQYDIHEETFNEALREAITILEAYQPDGLKGKQGSGTGMWKSCKETLPPSSKEVFLKCLYEDGTYYYCCGCHIDRHTEVCNIIDVDCSDYDYDDEKDEYYYKEGWYGCAHGWYEYTFAKINDEVIAWKSLPI